ncbi:2-hydroxycyclohexane-1-carbonyl-CoA dehydrogenase [Luteimicrobium album]|uniref:2-hydroxycyclohexane-1-carbonyl-CoA dehydrogenase n=1 Tax=Luteimicrobium album TaxID=1054550 RepID=A0ABQ6HXG3_9MICO|nr:SDR family oxidoreductase [Luteimicrobium album]GMA22548.1 2-hydroxycyclohexane-1-carbonyl-CoA dehydrogenase [Luteimicrobium album]
MSGRNGQVVLVTGAAGGIGQDVVRTLRDEGAVVMEADLGVGEGPDSMHLDVTDEGSCRDVVRRTVERHGRIDALVHAAGVLGATPDPFETTTAEFERVLGINTVGTFTMAREVGAAMRAAGHGGTMLFFSSVAAKEARTDYMPYNVSKIGVLHVMFSFAGILGPDGISVNAVCPGPVNTAMWAQKAADAGEADAARRARAAQLPMRRFAEPREVTEAVLFLTDPAHRYITGVSLDVAGGAHLGMGS